MFEMDETNLNPFSFIFFQSDKKKKSFFQRHIGSSSNEGDPSNSPLASPQVQNN